MKKDAIFFLVIGFNFALAEYSYDESAYNRDVSGLALDIIAESISYSDSLRGLPKNWGFPYGNSNWGFSRFNHAWED